MKYLTSLSAVILAISGLSEAAPRLLVSTASLLPESQVDFVFEKPMVGADSLGKVVENKLVGIEPALPGMLFWKSPTVAEFRPGALPSIGTKYEFAVNSGVKHEDGSDVEKGEFGSVSTESFRILASRIPNRYSSEYSAATGSWLIAFNDDVNPGAIAGFFGFSSGKNQRVAPDVRHATAGEAGYYRTRYLPWRSRLDPEKHREAVPPEASVKNIVIVTPNSPLPIADNWELRVLKGLPNVVKSATLDRDIAYRIGKVEAFKRTGASAVVGRDTPRQIVVSFNEILPENFSANLVSISPEVAGMVVETDRKALSIKGDFSAHDEYVVSVGKGVESAQARMLSNPGSHKVKFERVAPRLALPSEDEAQLAKGLRKYAIDTVNISKVKIRIKRLSGKGAVRAFQGYRNYTGNGPDWEGIANTAILPYSLIPGETLVEKEIETGIDVDRGKTLEFGWDEILPAGTDFGSLFVDVVGIPHEDADTDTKHGAQAIIQLTDLGLGWKFTEDSALLFAFSCETGKPLPGVMLTTYGEDAKKGFAIETDASGLATVPRNQSDRHLQATLGEDSYVVAFDKSLDQVGLWHFPVRYSWMKPLPETRRAFLFTERSLYRPGEKVRLKGIVRNQLGNAIAQPKKSPARVVIVDPKEKEILTHEVTLSDLGSFDFEFILPPETTGDHEIRLEFPDDLATAEETEDWELQSALEQNATFSLSLKVEEFRRNTFEITQTIAPPEIGADEIKANLTATYYQGQPVAAGKVNTFTQITTINPYPERYRDFLFGNHKRDDWRYWYHYFGYRDSDDDEITSSSLDSELVLSTEGETVIPVTMPQSDFPSAREISVGSEVTDSNNQTLTAKSSVTVHPSALYAGVSRVDRLIRVGDETPFRLVVTDTKGEPAGQDVTLTATVTRQVHTNTKTTNSNGDTVTESEPSEVTCFLLRGHGHRR